MMGFIENLRKKPKVVRNQYAFFGAAIFTLAIALVWAVSIPAKLATIGGESEEDQDNKGAFSQFLSEAKDNFAAAFESVKVGGELEYEATTTQDIQEGEQGLGLDIFKLSDETIEEVQKQNAPKPREIIIATTSKKVISPDNID
ncbi:MAG: hypothetical protein ACI9VM_000933 [Candidatus Azotimanducaceae bacterium]|jgi:hypothetical protein